MRTTAELREGFRASSSRRATRRPSGSARPARRDRSTLLTTAGMQPLMPYFLGREQPPAPLLTTVQKCFRTPDIDEVGLDGYHLTFFEMLGNFSFGQYFKEGAIELRVGVRLRAPEDRPRALLGHRLRGRPGARARRGRGRVTATGSKVGHAGRAHRPPAAVGELLVGRRPRPVRPGHGDVLRPGRGARLRRARLRARLRAASASSSSGTSSSWSSSCMRTAR